MGKGLRSNRKKAVRRWRRCLFVWEVTGRALKASVWYVREIFAEKSPWLKRTEEKKQQILQQILTGPKIETVRPYPASLRRHFGVSCLCRDLKATTPTTDGVYLFPILCREKDRVLAIRAKGERRRGRLDSGDADDDEVRKGMDRFPFC